MKMNARGLTLFELLLTIALVGIVCLLGTRILQSGISAYVQSCGMVQRGMETQMALERIIREMKTSDTDEIIVTGTNEVDFVMHRSPIDTKEIDYEFVSATDSNGLFSGEIRRTVNDAAFEVLLDRVTAFEVTRVSSEFYLVRIAVEDGFVNVDFRTGVAPQR
ncbi:MAG: type II secretion system protein [Candidatus Wallbacteria bacterium]|nr:type II secretion system protein [Candidatus Wallbacteria bacterium]